jgi:biotin transporter BioY
MENGALRTLIGTVAGTVLAFALVLLLQFAGNMIEPDVFDPETSEILISLPSTVGLLIGWFLGSFAGSWLAMRVSGNSGPGWIVAGAIIGAAQYRAWTLADAWWIVLLAIAIPLGAAWLAKRTAEPYFPFTA